VIALFLAPQAWAASQVEAPPLDRLLSGAGRYYARPIERSDPPARFFRAWRVGAGRGCTGSADRVFSVIPSPWRLAWGALFGETTVALGTVPLQSRLVRRRTNGVGCYGEQGRGISASGASMPGRRTQRSNERMRAALLRLAEDWQRMAEGWDDPSSGGSQGRPSP
jgi:hypothetical protein